jgi:excinuclease ABC subunit A
MRESTYTPHTHILIKNASMHNLKGVDVQIPKHKLVTVTGVSGSGKSTLVFDTLFAEGQRRYVESLSSYARQFLLRMDKPEVEYIKGLAPAIAIEQKVSTKSSRSTVGTATEIYDYLRLLYARIGKTYSPISGEQVKKDEVNDIVQFVQNQIEGTRILVLSRIQAHPERTAAQQLSILLQNGFSRIRIGEEIFLIEDWLTENKNTKALPQACFLLIDRFAVTYNDEDHLFRIADSIKTAFEEGQGECAILIHDKNETHWFSNKFERDGMSFDEPNEHFFSFNSPFGACKKCEGFGHVLGIDAELVFPNRGLSVFDGAIAPWKGEKMSEYQQILIQHAHRFNFPIHRPIKELTKEQYQLLWTGNQYFESLNSFFKMLESQTYKIQYRVMLSRYRGRTTCPECNGSRIRLETSYVKIDGLTLGELLLMPISDLAPTLASLKLNPHDQSIAKIIFTEINNRLEFLLQVGLGYLHLNRNSSTLSGGETQRIQLTRSLGSNLTSSLYILDEPSVGLHPRDTDRLVKVLLRLRDLGNTVLVVEHEEEVMRASDYIIDMGPEAGIHGGEVVFSGDYKALGNDERSLTTKYLRGELFIPTPESRRASNYHLDLNGCRQNNLKNVDVKIPLNNLVVVSGVSGSGKTTLIRQILHPSLQIALGQTADQKPGLFDGLAGDIKKLHFVELVDQNPLGKSSRSNPVTYVKAYDEIRDLFAKLPESKIKGLLPKHFSFNVEGGRCETCKGDGEVIVEMQFLADLHLQCEECKGMRFKTNVLEVKYKGKNIYDILNMTVDEGLVFFENIKGIVDRLRPLQQVGLGYIGLGQSSSTLSGGEAQRVKLASFLVKGTSPKPGLFIFDEPTTGLHFHDIQKLLIAFDALIKIGHSVIVVEHNLDVIQYADHVIDLGPEGGAGGGEIVFTGTPEELLKCKEGYTGEYLRLRKKAKAN